MCGVVSASPAHPPGPWPGLSHTPLGFTAVRALAAWVRSHLDAVRPHFPELLPLLGDYLSAGTGASETAQAAQDGDGDDTPALGTTTKAESFTKVAKDPKKRIGKQVVSRWSAEGGVSSAAIDATDAVALTRKVLVLLGRIGGDNRFVVGDAASTLSKSIAWDTQEHLALKLPLGSVKHDIKLDSILPQVVELALNSSDRQTKVAACELLHSLVVYMVGAQGKLGKDKQDVAGSFERLYEHIFPALLRYASLMGMPAVWRGVDMRVVRVLLIVQFGDGHGERGAATVRDIVHPARTLVHQLRRERAQRNNHAAERSHQRMRC